MWDVMKFDYVYLKFGKNLSIFSKILSVFELVWIIIKYMSHETSFMDEP